MSAVTLIEQAPRRPVDGTTETIRLCHNAVERANFLGVQWRPSAARLPTFESSLGFDGSNFGRGTTPVVGDMEIALEAASLGWAGLIWKGASVTLRRAAWTRAGADPADGDFQTIWQGRVDSAAVTDATLRLVMLDPGAQLRRPMVTRQFGTSGVAVLDAAPAAPQRGNLVPMGWGRLEGVPAILIDPADLIYLLVGQPANGVQGFYDGGAAFTTGVSRGSLAALRATSPAAGAVDYCLNADGLTLARPWTKPVYPFTADLTVGDARSAEVAVALVSSRTTIGFRAGTVAAYNALQGADIGLYVAEQVSIAECLDRIFAPLGSFWRLRSDGAIDLRRIDPGATPVRSFGSWQRERPERRGVVMPTRRRTLGYKPNWRVHGDGEIARSLLVTAGEVTYADGTPVEALKPAQPGANVAAPAANNFVPFSDFELADQWRIADNAAGLAITALTSGTASQRKQLTATVTFTASGQLVSLSSGRFGVQRGRLSVASLVRAVGTAEGSWSLSLFLWDSPSTGVASVAVAGIGGINFGDEQGSFVDIPAGYSEAEIRLYVTSGAAGALAIGLSQPMVSPAVAGQTQRPPYTRGLNARDGADVTTAQPIVSRLDPATGQATSRRIVTQIIASGVIQLLDINPISATTSSGGVATISIAAHLVLDDAGSVSFSAGSISGLPASTLYYVYEDNPNYVGGARTYVATINRNDLTAPGRRFVGAVTTPAAGGSASGAGGGAGGGAPGSFEFEP